MTDFQDGKRAVDEDWVNGEYSSDLLVAEGIASFLADPPDTDFQWGYLARLKEIFVAMQQKGGVNRAVHNSPPPLDDVGSDVNRMLDPKDPNCKEDC